MVKKYVPKFWVCHGTPGTPARYAPDLLGAVKDKKLLLMERDKKALDHMQGDDLLMKECCVDEYLLWRNGTQLLHVVGVKQRNWRQIWYVVRLDDVHVERDHRVQLCRWDRRL